MLKKFALLFALLALPTVVVAQDDAPPAPVPVADAAPAVTVGQGCVGCGTAATTVSGCGSCGTTSSCGTVSSCDPCARPTRARLLSRRSSCCTPAPTPCCTPAPAPCCTPAPTACCATPAPSCGTVASTDCCTPATRTRLIARRSSNCCPTPASTTCGTPVSSDCGCTSVATAAPVVAAAAPVAQVSYNAECCDDNARPTLRPFAGRTLRRAR